MKNLKYLVTLVLLLVCGCSFRASILNTQNFYCHAPWETNSITMLNRPRAVFTRRINSLPTGNHVFRTEAISAGADTVMQILEITPTGYSLIEKNDNSNNSLNSEVTINSPVWRDLDILIVVYAKSSTTGGKFNLYQTDTTSTRRIAFNDEFGAEFVDVRNRDTSVNFPANSSNIAMTYHTVIKTFEKNRWPRTNLFGMNDQGDIIAVGEEDEFGVTGDQFINAPMPNQITTLLVGLQFSRAGDKLAVYANDLGCDRDNDGLGRKLEKALKSCDLQYGGRNCGKIYNSKDSDLDGILDREEVFGIRKFDNGRPLDLMLARWGADPSRKDLFIEIDAVRTRKVPFSDSDCKFIEERFAEGPADHVLNADGQAGIAIHMDIGRQSNDISLKNVCADWGGFSTVNNTQWNSVGGGWLNRVNALGIFDPRRRGYFVHGFATNQGAQAIGKFFHFSVVDEYVVTFLHELGHVLTLRHEGHPDWGSINGSPIYDSLMNYTGQSGFFMTDTRPNRPPESIYYFTKGNSYPVTLNPIALDESIGIGGGNYQHLEEGFGLSFSGNVNDGEGVDWNHDGEYSDSNELVRAPVSWLRRQGAGLHAINEAKIKRINNNEQKILGGPEITRVGKHLYAFYIGQVPNTSNRAGEIYYRSAVIGSLERGGCTNSLRPNHVNGLNNKCVTWSKLKKVPLDKYATNLAVQTLNSKDLLLVYRDRNGYLNKLIGKSTVLSEILNWEEETRIAGARTLNGFDIEAMPRDDGEQSWILVWTDVLSNELKWASIESRRSSLFGIVFYTYSEFILRGSLLDSNSNPIRNDAENYIALTSWQDDENLENHDLWLVKPIHNDGHLEIYHFDHENTQWINISVTALPGTLTESVDNRKIALQFTPLLNDKGVPLRPLRGEVHLLYADMLGRTYRSDGSRHPAYGSLWISEVISANSRSLIFPENRSGRFAHQFYEMLSTVDQQAGYAGGAAYYSDLDLLPSLKAVVVNSDGTVAFLPHADGIFDQEYVNGSDWKVFERSLCLTLRNNDTNFCGERGFYGF